LPPLTWPRPSRAMEAQNPVREKKKSDDQRIKGRYGAHLNLHAMAETPMGVPDVHGARPPGNPTPRCLFPPEVRHGPDPIDNESIFAALGTGR